MKCLSCNRKETIEFEEIGEGKYCQECLDKEIKIWEKECSNAK